MEIYILLFKHAVDDMEDADVIPNLIEDIYQKRMFKLRQGLHNIAKLQTQSEPLEQIKLNNAAAMEIQPLRSLLTMSLNEFLKLHRLKQEDTQEDEDDVHY